MSDKRAVSKESIARARRIGGTALAPCLALAFLSGPAFTMAGCTRSHTTVDYQPDPTAGQLLLPAKVEIQRYWTRPISLEGKPVPDAMEVIVAAFDSCGDNTKMAGTLHVELYTHRPASSDKFGQRIGFWSVELNSMEQMTEHWDSLARFYRFPLQLAAPPLTPGRYVLTVMLQPPCGDRLMDEYEFEHEPGAVAKKGLARNGSSSRRNAAGGSGRQDVAGSPR